jgi:hypothetical protein
MALRTWCHYLHGNVVHIYIDHKSLKYILTQPDRNMRQRRCLQLIKDYELEVHYHPRRQMLLQMYWVARLTATTCRLYAWLEKSLAPKCYPTYPCSTSPSRLPWGMQEGDPKVTCFYEDAEGTLWFKERLVVPKKKHWGRKSWMKTIHWGTPFILGALRCIMAWGSSSGGQEWSVRQLSMFLSMTPTGRSRRTIWSMEGCCKNEVFQNGSGTI